MNTPLFALPAARPIGDLASAQLMNVIVVPDFETPV